MIGRMKWLRHLYLPRYLDVENSKVQWDNLSNLEMLKHFDGEQWVVQDLVHLTKLRKLKITNVNSFIELEVILKPSSLISNDLHSLRLHLVKTKMEEVDLRLVLMCQYLYMLFLGGEISNLPGRHHFPPKLTLRDSHPKQYPMPILERLLINLTILDLWSDFYTGEEMVFSKKGFPPLKYLPLFHTFSLQRLMVDKSAMPSLKSLMLGMCISLEMVPEGLRCITTLQKLRIDYMPREFVDKLQVINGKEGEDFYKVQLMPCIDLTITCPP